MNLVLPNVRAKRGKDRATNMLAKLEIIDNGPGVPPDVRSTLFEAFRSTKELGTGLGLFASRKILMSVNGDITYEPSKKIGTRFIIHFPFIMGKFS